MIPPDCQTNAAVVEKIYVGELSFNGDNAKDVEDGIKNILGNHSYAAAQVNLVPEFDEANHKVNFIYVVDGSRRYYVRNIIFKGNDASADKTLRQENASTGRCIVFTFCNSTR